ncbi:MAG: prepilin-type N-terminal cleavage/methylation domain-containing protein [Gemmataceae bacterium]|nr:prepilin-type N-terminal cleavage/methylation domain-containing protein [Gemmataceae bacterium]
MRIQRRAGYTIVELLVAMALIMTIMAILSEAFVQGLETFSKLKAIGDMSERLRLASTVLRRDLNADHFEARIRPSDSSTIVPASGFFRTYQGAPSQPEGACDGINSWYATTHVLHMAVKLRGNRQEDFFTASVPAASPLLDPTKSTTFFNQPVDARYQAATYTSQWAEVCYFLVPIPNAKAGGTPLYGLYRAQRVVVADSRDVNAANVAADPAYSQMSTQPTKNPLVFNNPNDLTDPTKRSIDPTTIIATVTATPGAYVDQLLLSDVISFTVRPMRRQKQDPVLVGNNLNAVGTLMPLGVDLSYDTASGIGRAIFGVEITIRVWDLKSKQTRQITIVQDL